MEPVVSTDNCAFTFIWRFENFSQCPPQKEQVLKSPLFIADSFDKSTWRIHIYPRGNIDGKCVEMYLFREDSGPERITIIYELSFLTADDKPHIVGKFKESNITKGETLAISTYPTVEEVFDTMRSTFLPFDTLTVRCRLWKPDEIGDDVIHCSASTRIGVEQKSYIWRIPDFSALRLGETITESIMSPWDFHDAIALKLHLSGTKMHKAVLDIGVIRESLKSKTLASCRLSVLDRAGKSVIFKEYESWGTDSQWKAPRKNSQILRFLYRRELMDKKNDYLPGDVLSLHFDFSLTYIIQIEASESSNYTPDSTGHGQTPATRPSEYVQSTKIDQALHSLQDDLLSLYEEPVFSDFKLQTTTKVFPVHKIVLCARSSFFKALFAENKEAINAFSVPDVDADVLDKMLLFMYTGTIENLEWEIATKLYFVAYKFGISSLKSACSEFLISNFAVFNVFDILMLLLKSYDRALETAVHEFILRHDNEIMLSRKWVDFMCNEAEFAAQTMHILYLKKVDISPELRYLMYTSDVSTQTSASKLFSEKNCETKI